MYSFKSSLVFVCLLLFARPSYQENESDRSSIEFLVDSEESVSDEIEHPHVNFASEESHEKLEGNLRIDGKDKDVEDEGIEMAVTGQVQVPPLGRGDYELFPGTGYYKFHTELKTLQEGMLICSLEGGHLMVANSQAEAAVATTLYTRHPEAWDWANIGFYDPNGDENYTTIFGKTLESAGYDEWYPNEPDHSQGPARCGVIHRHGLLGAGICDRKRPFICEIELP